LTVIRDFIAREKFPPTLKEIGQALGIVSNEGVTGHLRALERKGAIERVRGTQRGIRILAAT
jgi:repressor LexA